MQTMIRVIPGWDMYSRHWRHTTNRQFELLIERSYQDPTARNGQGPSEKPDRTARLGHYFVYLELVWAI